MAEILEPSAGLECPRCNHEILPNESHDEVAGVRTHRLQACFDFVKGDLDKTKSGSHDMSRLGVEPPGWEPDEPGQESKAKKK